ncbi:hypothetical protein ACOME3_007679 [Neoechinorhynchus agilis]
MMMTSSIDGFPYPRINGSLLSKYQSQRACVLGTTEPNAHSVTEFILRMSDGKELAVRSRVPLTPTYLPCLVEVTGTVGPTSRTPTFSADHLTMFSEEQAKDFDIELYDSAILISNTSPKMYPLGN